MRSGRETLGSIDHGLQSAQRELDRLDHALQSASSEITENRRLQARSLRELAALRLGALAAGTVTALDSADQRAQEALRDRSRALDELDAATEQARADLKNLEASRKAIHDRVDAAAQQLAELEARVQTELDADESYQAQLKLARESDATAAAAEAKTELSQADSDNKGKPYESDSLFMYLWRRGYGTSEYRANPLARMLDAWVARLIGYTDARANYWTLLEIPKRLAEHAQRLRDRATTKVDELKLLETAAAEQIGVADAQAELAEREAEQDAVDENIEQLEEEIAELQKQRADFAAGEDQYTRRGLTVLAEAMQQRQLRELQSLAFATPNRQDDALVDELESLRRRDRQLGDELTERRRVYDAHLRRVKELQSVRSKFKRHRYDDLRSVFNDNGMIEQMLAEFLRGTVRGGGLWDAIRRQQRYRDVGGAWPDFGSGGMRRRRQSGPWHWPGGRGGGFRMPRGGGSRSRSRPRGGFRTGGGF